MIQSTRQQGSQEVMLQRDWEELSQNFFFVPHSFPKYQDHIKKKKRIHYEILNSQLLLVIVKFKAIFNM